MDRGLWITWYDLPADGRDAHLAWVQSDYIPRILQRPGVLYGAHFASDHVKPGKHLRHTTDARVPAGADFVLIFGGESAHAFSKGADHYVKGLPARLDAGLTDADRRMLAMRSAVRVCVTTEVARREGPEAGARTGGGLSPLIQLGTFNPGAPEDEDELLTWYADWRFDALGKLPGCVAIRQIMSASGWAKHGVLYEFTSRDARDAHFPHLRKMYPAEGEWTDRCTPKLVHTPHSPIVARRLCQMVR